MTKQAQRLQEHFVILNLKKQEKDYQNDQIIFKCSRKYLSDKKQLKETLNKHFAKLYFLMEAFWHFDILNATKRRILEQKLKCFGNNY